MKEGAPAGQGADGAEFRAPSRYRVLVPLLIVGSLAVIGVVWYLLLGEDVAPPDPADSFLSSDGPPAIRLRPSLVVPGPMQNPHPVEDGGTARPDETIIFRVDIRGKGYVMVALESPSGRLAHVWGGRPDDTEMTGSHLLYDRDTGLVLAVDLGPHRGTSVTFVAALSSKPWDPFPTSGIPKEPRTYPNEQGTGKSPRPEWLAWDRFTVHVLERVPTPAPEKP